MLTPKTALVTGALMLMGASSAIAQSLPVLNLNQNFAPNPLEVSSRNTQLTNRGNCGVLPNSPSQVLKVSERIDYLTVSVENTQGQPTLLVQGADGDFCLVSEPDVGMKAQISGVWLSGEYKLYVGDFQGENHDFTLRFSR